MTCRPWPIAPKEPSERPDTATVTDGFLFPPPPEPLCRSRLGGCERDGTNTRQDVPHTTRGGKGCVAVLGRRSC